MLCQRACKANAEKIFFKKNPTPLKKNANTQADTDIQKSNITMTRELNNDNGLQGQKAERQLVTGVCCQWRGSASYDSFVHVATFVLLRKFSDESPNSIPPFRYSIEFSEEVELILYQFIFLEKNMNNPKIIKRPILPIKSA